MSSLNPGARASGPAGVLETLVQNAAPRSSAVITSSYSREVTASVGSVPASTGSLDSAQTRMISEVDLKNLKEYWAERCMFEVMKLEGCIFDKMDKIEAKLERQIRDMGVNQNTELRTLEERLQQQSEADAQKLQRRLETLRQEQRAETAEVLSSPGASVSAQLTQYQMQLDAVEASVADLRREFGGHLQYRIEQEDSVRIVEEKWSRWEAAQNEQVQVIRTGFAAEHGAKMQELTAALEATKQVTATCQQLQSEAAVGSARECSSLLRRIEEVSQRCDECSSKLQDVKQDQMCELVTLRGRFEASAGEQEVKLAKLESLTTHLKEESKSISAQSLSRSQSPEAEVVALLKKRMETFGVDLAVLSKRFEAQERVSAEEAKLSNDTQLVSRIDEIESVQLKWSQRLESLVSLQETVGLQNVALQTLKEKQEANHQGSANNLRAALTETRTDVGLLASQLAEEIQERQSTLLDIGQIKGQLDEEMSKAALSIMERMEQRLTSEIANERLWTEQLLNQQLSRRDCLDRLAELSTTSGGSGETDSIGASSELARNVGRIVGDMEAELRVQLTSRINSLQSELHSLQTEVSAHMSSIKVRLAAVESGSNMSQAAKPLDDLRAGITLAGRPPSSGADDAGSSSSRGTSEPAPPRLGRAEQDASVLEAIHETIERGIREGGTARSVSPAKLASLLTSSTGGQDTSIPRKSTPAVPPPSASQPLLSKDLKHTLEHLAEAVHRTLKEPEKQGSGRPHSASRGPLGPRGSFTNAADSGDTRTSPREVSRDIPMGSPINIQRQSPGAEARQLSVGSQHQPRSSSTQAQRRPPGSPAISDLVGAGSLTVKTAQERAASPKLTHEVNVSSSNLSTTARPGGSVLTEPGARPSLSADLTGSVRRTPATRSPAAVGAAGASPVGGISDANGVGQRGRQTRSLQPPGHGTNPVDGSPRSRVQAQSAAPNAGAVGTVPHLGPAATRVSSRPTGYPQTQPMARSPGPQIVRGTAGWNAR